MDCFADCLRYNISSTPKTSVNSFQKCNSDNQSLVEPTLNLVASYVTGCDPSA